MDSKDNLQFKALVKKKVMLFIKLEAHRKQAVFTSSIYKIIFKENNTILLPIKTMKWRDWRCSGVFIVNLEYASHLALVFLLWTLNM